VAILGLPARTVPYGHQPIINGTPVYNLYIQTHSLICSPLRNLWPELSDKFVNPPDSGNGTASDKAKEIYRKHCFPTEEELLDKIRAARREYLSAKPGRTLDVMYILTNAKKDWIETFGKRLRAEGWGTIVSTKDLKLDDEQTEVGMAVDMELARKAAVFIGNGVSTRSVSKLRIS
jgi:hypothetical protein